MGKGSSLIAAPLRKGLESPGAASGKSPRPPPLVPILAPVPTEEDSSLVAGWRRRAQGPPSPQGLLAAEVGPQCPEGAAGGGVRAGPGVGSQQRLGQGLGEAPAPRAFIPSQVHMDTLLTPESRLWKEQFWENPWDQGSLAVISLFILTVLFLVSFAMVFGALPPLEKAHRSKES